MAIKRFSIAAFNTYNLVLPEVTFYENKKYTKIPGFEHVNPFMPPETGSAPCVALATRFPLENATVIEQFPAAVQLSNDQVNRGNRSVRSSTA